VLDTEIPFGMGVPMNSKNAQPFGLIRSPVCHHGAIDPATAGQSLGSTFRSRQIGLIYFDPLGFTHIPPPYRTVFTQIRPSIWPLSPNGKPSNQATAWRLRPFVLLAFFVAKNSAKNPANRFDRHGPPMIQRRGLATKEPIGGLRALSLSKRRKEHKRGGSPDRPDSFTSLRSFAAIPSFASSAFTWSGSHPPPAHPSQKPCESL